MATDWYGCGPLALAQDFNTGTTTLNEGLLQLNKSAALNAIAGDLFVGNGTGAANSAE